MEKRNTHKKIDVYIKKVIAETCLAEGRENDVEYQFTIIEDVLIFTLRTNYQRVERKILRRLENNIPKNFGLKFNKEFDIYMGGFDLNYSVVRWDVFGEFSTLRAFGEKSYLLPRHSEQGNLTDFIAKKYENDEKGWNCYLKDYELTYGKPLNEIEKLMI